MKITKRQLRRIILEQEARPVTINPDSDEAKEIENKLNTLISDEGGAVGIDSEELETTLRDQGVSDPVEYIEGNPEFIELRDGDVISKEQLKTETSHMTASILRKIILQELAELIIEPESPCAAAPRKNVMHKTDHEGKMARKQLERTAALSNSLSDRMHDDTQLPAWVQSKITKAADYIQSVHNYLDEDLQEGKKKKKKNTLTR